MKKIEPKWNSSTSSRAEAQLEPESPISIKSTSDHLAFDQKHLQFQQHQQQLELASDNSRLAGPSEFQPAASKPPPKKVLNSQTKTKTGIKTKVKVVADLIILKLVYTTSNSSQPLKLANYTECHSTTP